MTTAAADSGPHILSVSLTPNPVELGSTVTISVSAQDVSGPTYKISAFYRQEYQKDSVIALLSTGPETSIELTQMQPMYYGIFSGMLSVGYYDSDPYGPTTLTVRLDGVPVPVPSGSTTTVVPVASDIDIYFLYKSTGGSMPMNEMLIEIMRIS